MNKVRSLKVIACALALVGALQAGVARADAIEDFYKGKTVTIIVGAGTGGLYDEHARLIARYLNKYIPGNPTIVPQNMPGASQLLATEYSYNIAPKDGTSLLVVQAANIVSKLLDPKLKFDQNEFTWIGRVTALNSVGFTWNTAEAKTVDDARAKEVILGANAPNGRAATVPNTLNRLAGTKFKLVLGYQGERDEVLAMQRGEIQGVGNFSIGDLFTGPAFYTNKMINVLYIVGLERLPQLPGVPTIVELASKEEDRDVMRLIAGTSNVGVSVMAPPKMPAARTAALRKAFMQMMQDPDYVSDLKKIGYDAEPIDGAELQKMVKDDFKASPELIERVKAITGME